LVYNIPFAFLSEPLARASQDAGGLYTSSGKHEIDVIIKHCLACDLPHTLHHCRVDKASRFHTV